MSDHGNLIKQNYIRILGKTAAFMAAYCHRNIIVITIVRGVDTVLLYS